MANKRPDVLGIPKTETIWVTFTNNNGEIYYITAKTQNRDYYYLYKLVSGKAEKLDRARSPVLLEEKYF